MKLTLFIKTKYFRILKAVIAIIIIGVLFKIMHWKFSNLILPLGFIGVIITYLLSFLNKPLKNRLDFFKLTWVIFRYTTGILVLSHLIPRDYQIFGSLIMWIMIFDYSISEFKKRTLFK